MFSLNSIFLSEKQQWKVEIWEVELHIPPTLAEECLLFKQYLRFDKAVLRMIKHTLVILNTWQIDTFVRI